MENETIGIILTALGLGGGLIWLVIKLSTKPLIDRIEIVVENNTAAMNRVFTILDRHESELKDHGEHIAALDERTAKPARKRSA